MIFQVPPIRLYTSVEFRRARTRSGPFKTWGDAAVGLGLDWVEQEPPSRGRPLSRSCVAAGCCWSERETRPARLGEGTCRSENDRGAYRKDPGAAEGCSEQNSEITASHLQ